MAEAAVARLLERVEVVIVDGGAYRQAMRRCSDRGLRSGAIFDALHLVSAEERRVDAFVTFNRNDFVRLAGGGSPPIVMPPDPPAIAIS